MPLLCLATVFLVSGCRSMLSPAPEPADAGGQPMTIAVPENQIAVFVYRHANFAGGGRTHVLEVDGKPVGTLTGDNYYRLDMWPGDYEIGIARPAEEFLGQVNPATNFSRQFSLKPHLAGKAYVCRYTDGLGAGGIFLESADTFPDVLTGRSLAAALTARYTAQVTHRFGARYDGPAVRGRPHGRGTLTWPDGSVFAGVFTHGDPTPTGRFVFPDGRRYMGPTYRGRPAGRGLLMSPDGKILFAGRIANERPHGTGLRVGQNGPEFCRFEDGRDVTQTFHQLAAQALDAEDRQQITGFSRRADTIDADIQALRIRIDHLALHHNPDGVEDLLAANRRRLSELVARKHQIEKDGAAQMRAFVKQLDRSRRQRERARAEVIRQRHQAAIEKARNWCLEEFSQGRQLCICVPFAQDADQWEECREPLRPRYVY
jgi:hypothetical protein